MLISSWEWLALIDAYAWVLFLAGFVLVAAFQLWKWRSDRRRALMLADHPELPVRLDATPKVSILVAAWNEEKMLNAHIQSILELHYPDLEYVLCAGGKDRTMDIASHYNNIHVLEQQPGEGKQKALQHCLEASSGELIYLTDADCIVGDFAFTQILAPMINTGEAVATGTSAPLLVQRGNPFVLQQWFAQVYVQAFQGGTTQGILGRNAALKRSVLQSIGDFKTDVHTGTDYFLAKSLLRSRISIVNMTSSVVQTPYPQQFREYRRQQTRWLRNVVIHGLKFKAYGEVFRCLLPSILGLWMLLGCLLALAFGQIILYIWLLTWLHVLFSRVRYILFGQMVTGYHFAAKGYLRLPVYALLDFVVWCLVLFQYPLNSLRQSW